ncbi:MAG: hypothetical protein SPL30_02880 [Succinivibrio sp.]|nr:hypothetical protein [Succinivibrio sp.]
MPAHKFFAIFCGYLAVIAAFSAGFAKARPALFQREVSALGKIPLRQPQFSRGHDTTAGIWKAARHCSGRKTCLSKKGPAESFIK